MPLSSDPFERNQTASADHPKRIQSRPFLRFGVENTPAIESSVIYKMSVGAAVMTVAVGIVSLRVMVATYGDDASINPVVALVIFLGSVAAGAFLGGLLACKDFVAKRMRDGKHVAGPMRLLFAYGLKSLLLVWFPMILFGTVLLMPLALLFQ